MIHRDRDSSVHTIRQYQPIDQSKSLRKPRPRPRHTRNTREALPWRVFLGCPACISPVSCLYFTESLGIPFIPVSILYLFILQHIHCIPLYPTVSSCIRTYLAVSSCIPLYLTAYPTPRKRNIAKNTLSRGGLKRSPHPSTTTQ